MTEEGEFKKRIQEKGEFLHQKGLGWLLANQVEVIDEAAKEFPISWPDWLQRQPEWEKYPQERLELAELWRRYSSEMREWFVKWFGSE